MSPTPPALFLTEHRGHASGSAVVVSMEGTRPLLVEVQALATTTAFGTPRCTTNGVDHNRVLMLLAVLTKRVGLALGNQDVYVNVAGGFTLERASGGSRRRGGGRLELPRAARLARDGAAG